MNKITGSWTSLSPFVFAAILFMVPAAISARQADQRDVPIQVPQQDPAPAALNVPGGVLLQAAENQEIRTHIGRILERETWPNMDLPAAPTGVFLRAGDINGDGSSDVIQHRTNLPDLRTDDLTVFADRTLLFFSGSFDGEPDMVIYDVLRPAGDLNGDGQANLLSGDIFGNLTIYHHDGAALQATAASTDGELPSGLTLASTRWGTDIDGDGFGDLAFTLSPAGYPDANNKFFILFGGDPEQELNVGVYDIRDLLPPELENMMVQAVTDLFVLDGASHLILSMRNNFGRRFVAIIAIDDARTANLIQAIQLTDYSTFSPGVIFAAVLSEGEDMVLVASDFGFRPDRSFYLPASTEDSLLFGGDPVSLHHWRVWPAGDLNGDGAMNLVAEDSINGPLHIADFPNGTDSRLSLGELLPGQDQDVLLLRGNDYYFGDLTGDGRDNLIYAFHDGPSGLAGVNRATLDGQDDFTAETWFYDVEQSFPLLASDAHALGDVTGNGNDDFAITYDRFPFENILHFHEGGAGWQTPAATWTLPAGRRIVDIVSGHFVDTERLDILILYTDVPNLAIPSVFESALELHTGGGLPNPVPDRVLGQFEVYPGTSGTFATINTMANAGDVNQSGYDDLLLASGNIRDAVLGPLPALLYAGGPSFLNQPPDAEFSFTADDIGFGIGGTLAGLGDINGDGFDDFAIANISEGINADWQEFGSFSLGGRIHIYFGRDGDTNFDEPDITLRADLESISSGNDQDMFGMSEIATGDFLGTGSRGIVAKPMGHYGRANSSEGVPGIHLFQRNLLDEVPVPDQLLPLHADIMSVNPQSEFVASMGRALMAGIPDLTGNGRDELLIIGSSPGSTNAVLHFGRDPLSIVPDVLFESPNTSIPMGARVAAINRHNRSAIGDFNGDGSLNFLAVQTDLNYPQSPAYLYELGRPSAFQVQVNSTETVGSGGGVVTDDETGASVLIPEGALDSDVDIEVGTFSEVPEGADLAGLMIYLGPAGTTFNEPVEVTVSYDPDNLPDGVAEEDLVLLRFDEADGAWEELPSTVDTDEKTVTGLTTRFSGFAAGRSLVPTRTDHTGSNVPEAVALHQNYPNPFNPVTSLSFDLVESGMARLTIHDVLGRHVATLADGDLQAGRHQVSWDASRYASGVYIVRLETAHVTLSRRIMLVK